jgi:hypothetical protein
MKTITHALPQINLMRLPALKSQQPAHISHSAFLTQPSQLPSPSQDGPLLDTNMDSASNLTNMDTFGAGTGTSELLNSSSPATPATNKCIRPAASDDDIQSKVSSGAKCTRLDNVNINSSDGSAPPKEKKILQFTQYFTVPLVVRTDSARTARTTQNPSKVRTESVRSPNKFHTVLVESADSPSRLYSDKFYNEFFQL